MLVGGQLPVADVLCRGPSAIPGGRFASVKATCTGKANCEGREAAFTGLVEFLHALCACLVHVAPGLDAGPLRRRCRCSRSASTTKGMHSKEVKRIFEAAPLPGARAEQSPAVRCGTALCRADSQRMLAD